MQETAILDFLAYVWALGIVPTSTPVSADRKDPISDQDKGRLFDADAIKSETELQAALSDPETVAITLASDIITLENLIVNRNDSIELNLNGFKIASLAPDARVIDIQSGDIAILGLGSIVATGADASAVRIKGAITAENVNYSRLTIGADVTLYAPNYYGIFVTTNYNAAYGVTIDFYGSIIAHDGIGIHGNIQGHGDNIPHINLQDGAKIIADEHEGSAICAFGNAIWEINTVKLTGGTGVNLKSGIVNLRNANLVATGDSDLFPGSGAAIRLEDNPTHYADLKIYNGSYLSVQNYVFYEHAELSSFASLQSLEIYDGSFFGQLGICFGIAPCGSENSAARIYGGKFNTDISRYLAPEHHAEPNSNHSEYVVIDDTEPTQILDKITRLELARAELSELITLAKRYTRPSYTGNELGEIQSTVNKIIGAIKRAMKASEKLLKSPDLTITKIKNSARRLEGHLEEIRSIENAMRAEISEAIDFSKLDQSRYTRDSFLDLSLAAADAEQLLATDAVTLVELQDMLGVIDAAKIMLEESEDYDESLLDQEIADSAPEPIIPVAPPLPEPSPEENLAASVPDTPPAMSTVLPEDLPLRPAPRLFSSLPEPPATPVNIEQAMDSFVDDFEEPLPADSLESAFVIDDLEVAEVTSFIDQLRTAELISDPAILEESSEAGGTPVLETPPDPILESPLDYPAPEPPISAPPIPTFVDPELIAAQQSLRELLNGISALDPADYTVESYTILARTANMAGNLLAENSSNTTAAVLLSAFNSVSLAYERLAKKSENLTSSALETVEQNLRDMLDAVQVLTVSDYEAGSAEQFGELQVAIAKAKALLARDISSLSDILDVMDEIKVATSGLKVMTTPAPVEDSPDTFIVHQSPVVEESTPTPVALDWSDFTEALNDIRALDASDYTSESYQKLLAVLENAKVLSGKTNLTQAEIDEIVFELNLAILALERLTTPRLSETQTFANSTPAPRVSISTSDVPTSSGPSIASPSLAADDSITPSLLMSMMAGAYAGLATYRRSRLEAKKRKNFRSA